MSVEGTKRNVEMAKLRIDSIAQVASEGLHRRPSEVWNQLAHSMGVARSIKDSGRTRVLVDVIQSLLNRAEPSDCQTWTFAFDILTERKTLPSLETEEVGSLLKKGHAILVAQIESDDHGSHWPAEEVATRLARWYSTSNNRKEAVEVILSVANLKIARAKKQPALVAQSWLQSTSQLLRDFGLLPESKQVDQMVLDIGPRVVDELKSFSTTVEVPKEKLDHETDLILAGTWSEAHPKLVVYFTPDLSQLQERRKQMAEVAPLSTMLTKTLLDNEGRPVGHAPGVRDAEASLSPDIYQDIAFSAPFLRYVINESIQRNILTLDVVMSEIRQSLLCSQHAAILERGLEFYFDGDALASMHILIPQIETAVRNLARLVGDSTVKQNRDGGLDHRPLDALLRGARVGNALTEDNVTYLRALLTDRKGANLRNRICHGLMSEHDFQFAHADRLLHALLLLLLVRQAEESETNAAPAEAEAPRPPNSPSA